MPSPEPSERWQRVQELFHGAVECPPDQREAFLYRECVCDRELRSEVEWLLTHDRKDESDLSRAIEDAASLVVNEELIGTRLGPYRVRKEIGRGGMGSVFLAVRDDDQYHKKVAVKVIRRGMDTEDVLTRFRHEREILASLDHPYIAHLLDGGTTPDGRPYLVMEYVEGEQIDIYCKARGLSLKQKLELFCQVCEAVSFAHRNLIVHRDIKPGNIFVTAPGTPKLLDFGIAKLLHSPDLHTQTQTMTSVAGQMLTPAYASPEQVRGMPVSTSSDVYSLAVVLYQLLAGARPYVLKRSHPDEIERAVCAQPPQRPSLAAKDRTVSRQLSGDLDNILLMALRKEPERRYPSADEFASDIRRYLNGLPVAAREDTFRYRTSKFVRRHSIGVLAAATVTASLVAGVLVAGWQANQARQQTAIAREQQRIAEQTRESAEFEARGAQEARRAAEQAHSGAKTERDRAVQESRLAQRRLHEMIQLANKTVFDMHDQLASLRGATEPRRKLISGVVEYLDSVSKEAGNDPFVLLSLASAYYKLGDVQGRPEHPSLGDYEAAARSYARAFSFAAKLREIDPNHPDYLQMSATVLNRQGLLLRERGKPNEGAHSPRQEGR